MKTGKVALSTDFGLLVTFDGDLTGEVYVDDSYSGHMCGLCGDNDGNPDNDLKVPDGTLVTSDNEFGNKWADFGSEPR